jgi:hypothetical protein
MMNKLKMMSKLMKKMKKMKWILAQTPFNKTLKNLMKMNKTSLLHNNLFKVLILLIKKIKVKIIPLNKVIKAISLTKISLLKAPLVSLLKISPYNEKKIII